MSDHQSSRVLYDLKDYYLDILGQLPGLKIYTQITLCYSMPDTMSHSTIVDNLTRGLERLSTSFPWIAGQVVSEGVSEGNTGLFKIEPLEKIPRFVVKHLDQNPNIPTMNTLRSAKFPMSMLDESLIAPRMTLPGSPQEAADVSPVFCVQANFIQGGMLLTFVSEHNTMDMTGQGQMMYLLSKACRSEPFTTQELETGNLARRNLIPYLDDSYTPGAELEYQIVKPQDLESVAEVPAPPKSSWANFNFSAACLESLKAEATKTIPDSSKFISTDDALTSFLWKSIMRARRYRLDKTTNSILARAINARGFLGIPNTYPGLIQNMTYHKLQQQQIVNEPLGTIAFLLRLAADLSTSDVAYRTRALATFLNRNPNKSLASFTAANNASTDVAFSSWAKVDCYSMDFGLGIGKPESVRRPRFVPVESLLYLMPMEAKGGITAAVCLRDEDMNAMMEDEEFSKYAEYIG